VELMQAVRQRLANHPSLTLDGIEISAADGIVTLSGQAESDFERQQAELATVWVDGVKRVDNELEVSSELIPDRDDETLAAELASAFAEDPRIDPSLVGLQVERGVVTLSGTLPDWDMVDAVLERTYSTLPRAVVNHLERQALPQRPSER
ncbi:MAG TPA: BON domain-containing protein, partial [Polyangiaceae bacterium]|nr:BON domain-containing protein [Polyangiaceae bacterium]